MPVLQFDEKFRKCFWNLASVKESLRETSASDLLTILQKEQETSPDDPKQLNYALTRLIRGLSSSRDGARQGFSVALTQLLRRFPTVKTLSYIKSVNKILPRNPQLKGKEEREVYYGRIFAILVLARANRFIQEADENNSDGSDEEMEDAKENNDDDSSSDDSSGDEGSDDEDSSDDEEEEISNPLDWAVTTLNDLRTRKEQLEQLCYYTIGEIFRQLPLDMVKDILEAVHSSLLPSSLSKLSASQLYFTFLIEHEFKWTHPDGSVYSSKNLDKYINALVSSFNTHPELHIVWKSVLQFCFPSANFDIPPPSSNTITREYATSQKGYFTKLWNNVIEEKLFHSDSHQKKYLGFQIAEQVLPNLSSQQVPSLFTHYFGQCIINSLHSTKNLLHAAASHFLQAIVNSSDKMSSPVKYALVLELLKLNRNFDAFSKSKTVEHLVSHLQVEEIEKYLDYLREQFYNVDTLQDSGLDEEQKKAAIDAQRIRVLNRMLTLCRTAKVKEENYLSQVLQFYLFHGFFSFESKKIDIPKKSIIDKLQWKKLSIPEIEISERIVEQCKTTLTSLLKELATLCLSSNSDNNNNNAGKPGEKDDGSIWPSYALQIYSEFQSIPNVKEISPLSDESLEILSNLTKLGNTISSKISNLQKKEEKEKSESKKTKIHNALKIQLAYRILTLNCAILLYFESESDLLEAMGDLIVSYKEIESTKKGDDGLDPYDVVTEIIVSLLTRSSAYLRTVATRSFGLLTSNLPSSSISILVDIIDPSKQEVEYDDFESDIEEDDEEFEPFSLPQKENNAGDIDMDGVDDDSSDDESEDDSSDDSDDENTVIDEALEKELLKLQEENGGPPEDIYIEDAPLEELKKFNERLQTMLATMKKHARENDEKRTLQIDHKMKVLDLMETFIRHESGNSIVLTFLEPFCKAIVSAEANKSEGNYLNKLRNFISHKYLKVVKISNVTDEQAKQLLNLYNQIAPISIGSKRLSSQTMTVIHEIIFFIVKHLSQNENSMKELVESLKNTFNESAEKPLKYFDWVLWTKLVRKYGDNLGSLGTNIMDKFILVTVKPFALGKALDLFDIFTKHHSNSLQTCKSFKQSLSSLIKEIPTLLSRSELNTASQVTILNTTNSVLTFIKGCPKFKFDDWTPLVTVLKKEMKQSSQKIRSRCNNCLSILHQIDSSIEKPGLTGTKRQRNEASPISQSPNKKQRSSSEETDVSKVKSKKEAKEEKESSKKKKRQRNRKNKK